MLARVGAERLTPRKVLIRMQVFRVQGGRRLVGKTDVPGSKNAALAILSAIPLSRGVVTLRNLPNVSDVRIKLGLLAQFGAVITDLGDAVHIDARAIQAADLEEEVVRKIRTGFYLLGPLLARLGAATLPMPGGCQIGARPVDFHLKGLRQMGARVDLIGGHYVAQSPQLEGTEIYLEMPSAGATQHLMATATLANGVTVIDNASAEPEVVSLAAFLQSMGARIEGVGTPRITITGVKELGDTTFSVPADRLQASTYLLAGVATRGDVTVTGILPEHQTALLSKLRESGFHTEEGFDWVRVWNGEQAKGVRVKTMPYPGFPTDIQQPMCAVLATCQGASQVEETIYESRIGHVRELSRMGANIRTEGRLTVIEGVRKLQGATVEASDLRAGAALVIAGLCAEGETTIRNIHWIDRGYEEFEMRIARLGGVLERVNVEEVSPVGS